MADKPVIAVLTVSDRSAAGEREDRGGPAVTAALKHHLGWTVQETAVVPDSVPEIAAQLRAWVDADIHLVLTTGGTGFAPRDVTPEATRSVIEREAPGLMEAVRAYSLTITRHAMLSRGVAGMRNQTLIINLPGNPKAVKETFDVIAAVLPHALDLLRETAGTETQHRAV